MNHDAACLHVGADPSVGEVSGSENVYVDGELEGSVELTEGNLL
jgi:hypothetical protein